MDATATLALVAVISAAQVTSLVIMVKTCQRLATLATRSAHASTPQELVYLEREAAHTAKIMKSKEDPVYPIGL